jgi:predicted PurR-regulated permease PerM
MGPNIFPDPSSMHLVEKDDIFLLLESYKNSIELSSTLLEQQKQIVEKESEIIKNQNEIIKKIEDTTDTLEKLSDKQTSLQIESNKDHNKLYTLIYFSLGGMVSIILGLIGLLVMFSDKFNLIKNIAIKVGAQMF